MGLWEGVQRFFTLEPIQPLQTRQASTLEDFAWSILGNNARREWRLPTVNQALGVPSVLNAVTMIASITGTLSMQVKRNGEPIEPPPVVRRPNPLTTPQEFWRDTAYSMATRGEAFWWIAKRDDDRSPLALFPINPVQIVDETKDGRRVWRWGDRILAQDDVIQLTYLRELGEVRGNGPLQLAGAALSVAVEAQDWAANFYAEGGYASTLIKHATELDPTPDENGLNEAQRLLNQWLSRTANNVTRVIDQNIESVEHHEPNESAAQMLQARMYQNGEVANMFGIPGPLLEYSAQGASLTYRNIPSLIRQLVDMCLRPRYWEAMEHAMSDLLPRSQKATFDTDALLRDDIKTQYEVANIGFKGGFLDRDEARSLVHLDPGIDDQPVPLAPPRAMPTLRVVRERRELVDLRCTKGHLVARVDGNAEAKCRTCGQMALRVMEEPPAPMQAPTDRLADAIALLAIRGQLEGMLAQKMGEVIESAHRPRTLIPERDAPRSL